MGLKLVKDSSRRTWIRSMQLHLLNMLRGLVSKKRRRLLIGGFDLDMSYITDRVVAMSFPSERMRAVYRNPMWQVKSVLDMRHPAHYKVYNLCIEESYDPENFEGRVERFPFDDNHVPPLQMIKVFCKSVHSWLSQDPKNVAVIHCMAGKGRTGLMVCCYLVYSGMSAEEALKFYAHKRTTNNEGVSIPSQRRYVAYWSRLLSHPRGPVALPQVKLPTQNSRELRRIRLYDTVNIDSVFFAISQQEEVPGQLYWPPVEVSRGCCRQIKKGFRRNNSPRYYLSFVNFETEEDKSEHEEPRVVVQMDTESSIIDQKTCLDYYFDTPVKVRGDVRITFYEKMIGTRLFYVCFNTAFITNGLLQFSIAEMDKVGSRAKARSGPAFGLELLFGPANANLSTMHSQSINYSSGD